MAKKHAERVLDAPVSEEQVPAECIAGTEFRPRQSEHCRVCPMMALARRIAGLMPPATLRPLVERGIGLQLKHPDRPALVCGVVWDLQHCHGGW